MPGFSADVVLGQDFLKEPKEVVIKLDGSRDCLVIKNKYAYCGVSVSGADRRLFQNLDPGCKPIAVKSRKFNQEDKQFIKEEVRQLLKDEVIEPSLSTWPAQVLVARNPRPNLRMVIDYSQTITRYTLLDAYPLPNIDG